MEYITLYFVNGLLIEIYKQ